MIMSKNGKNLKFPSFFVDNVFEAKFLVVF